MSEEGMATMEALEHALLSEAIAWWARHKPEGWSLEQHLDSPCLNTSHDTQDLALAVARYVKAQQQALTLAVQQCVRRVCDD